MVGKLIVVPLREIWENEAKDFTTWLEKNIDVLNEHLSIDLDDTEIKRESAVGSFKAELIIKKPN